MIAICACVFYGYISSFPSPPHLSCVPLPSQSSLIPIPRYIIHPPFPSLLPDLDPLLPLIQTNNIPLLKTQIKILQSLRQPETLHTIHLLPLFSLSFPSRIPLSLKFNSNICNRSSSDLRP